MNPVRAGLIWVLALMAGPCFAQDSQRFHTEKVEVVIETAARGLDHPWSLAFLPDGHMLVTERPGRLRLVHADGGLSQPIGGVPHVVSGGQAGLLDLALDPDFSRNRLVYMSFIEDRGAAFGLSVMRARLNEAENGLEDTRVIFRAEPAYTGYNNLGSRLVFDRSGALFVTVGDRFALRDQAQHPDSDLGKVVRITTEGAPAPDNPFLNSKGTRPEIWSIGHRNPEGATLHPETGELWIADHGARGGDEINVVRKGKNYGWPVITYGVDYSGAKIGEGTAKPGMEQPLYYWDPSIAPSGALFYMGDQFPAWRGSLLIGALKGELVSRLETSGDKITSEERMFHGLGERIRDVRQGPDGLIYLLTDSPKGRILRVKPAI